MSGLQGRARPAVDVRVLAMAAVCLAATLPYLQTIPDYFLQDDYGGMQLLAGKPWHTFFRWFTMPWMEFVWGYTPDEIRPFTALSYQISDLGRGDVTEGHHILNIALHAANSLLVLGIAGRAGRLTLPGATLAALVFAVLPSSSESVAWITGRVDSLPAFFYLLSFYTYVRWRRDGSRRASIYVLAAVWFFMALFSKQNTITMVAALAAYDLLLERRPIRPSWGWLWPYIPFALLTAAFLGLRYMLLGEVLRERLLSSQRLDSLAGLIIRHLQRIAWGDVGSASEGAWALALAFAAAAIVCILRAEPDARQTAIRGVLYFGPVWLALGLAPTVAAGYESPRHGYLAAAGWTILIGIAYDAVRQHRVPLPRVDSIWKVVVTAATAAIVVSYTVALHANVRNWNRRAAVAELAVRELERVVQEAPPGSLVLVDVPVPSWEWAMPFTDKPPYARVDLTERASIVGRELLHCCRGKWWENEARAALQRWDTARTPIVALHIDSDGEVRVLSDADAPELVTLVSALVNIRSASNLDGALHDVLRKFVAGRGRVVRGPL